MSKVIKNLKQFSTSAERFEGANKLCPGCAHSIIVREVLNATNERLVLSNSTGCLEVCTAIFPYTSWDASWIHLGFQNSSTVMSGVQATYKSLRNKGKLTPEQERIKFVTFGGDGSTYDIGFQYISAAFERGTDFMYVCLDNEVYANTGGQRSSSTPTGAHTMTTQQGKASAGKKERKKDIVGIMAAHGAPYVAQAAPSKWKDMIAKVQKGYETVGPVFINALSACTTEWKFAPHETVDVTDLAVDSLMYPLYEIIDGVELNITYRPKKPIPVEEYFAAQGRFKHLFKKENRHIIETTQKQVEERWDYLQKREEFRPRG